jgi:hypothetical protein
LWLEASNGEDMMAYRVTVRLSIDGEKDSKVRNQCADRLEAAGLVLKGTATWKSASANLAQTVKGLKDVLDILANPTTHVKNAAPGVTMDHIWAYIEKVDDKTHI